MILKGEVPHNANIIGGMFVVTIKVAKTENPICKVRQVMHEHKEIGKDIFFISPQRQTKVQLECLFL